MAIARLVQSTPEVCHLDAVIFAVISTGRTCSLNLFLFFFFLSFFHLGLFVACAHAHTKKIIKKKYF